MCQGDPNSLTSLLRVEAGSVGASAPRHRAFVKGAAGRKELGEERGERALLGRRRRLLAARLQLGGRLAAFCTTTDAVLGHSGGRRKGGSATTRSDLLNHLRLLLSLR